MQTKQQAAKALIKEAKLVDFQYSAIITCPETGRNVAATGPSVRFTNHPQTSDEMMAQARAFPRLTLGGWSYDDDKNLGERSSKGITLELLFCPGCGKAHTFELADTDTF
jgi:hypothetical protein